MYIDLRALVQYGGPPFKSAPREWVRIKACDSGAQEKGVHPTFSHQHRRLKTFDQFLCKQK